ncbi:MAG TPA: type II toxin-antitoxin system HicB family antitoxin [Chloroflexi bacterium]|nr:type II toxin-antitoxin system HicB family antitoxin [Chloroflexota bacterium]
MVRRVSFEEYVRLALSYAVYERDEDGKWTVEVPMLPGCVTWGETRAEAVEMAEDAIKGWILTALRFGDELPVIDGAILDYSIDEQLAEVA